MKVIKLMYILLFAAIAISIISCKLKNSRAAEFYSYKEIYVQSMAVGNYASAVNAINNLLVADTANTLSYKDSLANLYLIQGEYTQAIVIGKEVLAKLPYDMGAMAVVAAADQQLNNADEALDYYQELYARTHSLFQLYQIARIQFDMDRIGECNETIDRIIADPNSVRQTVQLTIAQGQQLVPYKAIAFNIRGVIAKRLNQNAIAKKAFEDALAVYPDFILAKNNSADLGKR